MCGARVNDVENEQYSSNYSHRGWKCVKKINPSNNIQNFNILRYMILIDA